MTEHPNRGRILIIDDEGTLTKVIRKVLRAAGYAVTTVTNAKAGLTDAVFGRFDLAFVDLLMPEINGVEMIRAMKLINMDLKIIIFTAFREKFHKDLKGIEVNAAVQA